MEKHETGFRRKEKRVDRGELEVHISRSGEDGGGPRTQTYRVPKYPGGTLLQALLDIFTYQDSTLAFRYGCRFKRCGLCAVQFNGRSHMACLVRVVDGTEIRPLNRLPVARDLVIDRRQLFEAMRAMELYLPMESASQRPISIYPPASTYKLAECTECLCCLAECPHYDWSNPSFAGPYFFVQLARLHYDPRNKLDRRKQAHALGIEHCLSCKGCYCPYGINIRKEAIGPLLGKN